MRAQNAFCPRGSAEVAVAISLSLISVWPMELTCSDSFASMPSMSVRGLGRLIDDNVRFVECCVWLDWSLGDFATSAIVMLCEKVFAKQRALISLDNRCPFLIRRSIGTTSVHWTRMPKIGVLCLSGHLACHRIGPACIACFAKRGHVSQYIVRFPRSVPTCE